MIRFVNRVGPPEENDAGFALNDAVVEYMDRSRVRPMTRHARVVLR